MLEKVVAVPEVGKVQHEAPVEAAPVGVPAEAAMEVQAAAPTLEG